MKKVICFTLLFTSFLFSQQKKFYITSKKNIFDEKTYQGKKAKALKIMKEDSSNMEVYEEFTEKYQNKDSIIFEYTWHFTDNVNATRKEITKKKKIIGKIFPLSEVTDIDGKNISINDFFGKPTLINLWFTACAPCVQEIPVLNNLKRDYSDKFNFIAITFDSREKVLKLLEKQNYNFIQIVNSKKLTKNLGIDGYPVNIFLDSNGIVREMTGNIPIFVNDKNEQVMSDGKEFVKILERYINK